MTRVGFDADLIRKDVALKGWGAASLHRHSGVAYSTVSRFMRTGRLTPRNAKSFAEALGYPLDRYLVLVGSSSVETRPHEVTP